ncbi:MAG: histidine kinase dimerization/phospho-acceptor domain-containing protein, partial [Bacteroidota bacterium]
MKPFATFPLLTANLRIHKIFLRYAFLITVIAIGLDGFVIRYLKPDYVEPLWLRIGIILSFFGCFLTTFSNNWKHYSWGYVGVYLLFGIGTNIALFQNGWFDRMFFWLLIGLVVWGYLVKGLRQFHLFYLSYLLISLLGLFISPTEIELTIHYGTVLLLVATLSYLITVNLKLNYRLLRDLNQRLTSSQKLLTKAQGIAQIGNWEIDLASLAIQFSPEMYPMYQLPVDAPLSLADILPFYLPDSQKRLKQAIEACRETGEPFDLKLEVFPRAGNIQDVRIVGFRETRKGVATRLYGLIQNITSEQMIQRRLQLAKEAAEEARDAKSQFLSVMSHEIRTPMNAVIGSAYLLAQENPREDQQDHLHTLQHSAENLLSLINNILDFSKIEAGKVELEQVPFPLVERLRQLQGMYQFQAREKGVELELSIPEQLPEWVLGDPV